MKLSKVMLACALLFAIAGCASDGRMAQYPQYYQTADAPVQAPTVGAKDPQPTKMYIYEQRVWVPVTAYTPPEQFPGGTASGWYKVPAQDPIASPTNFGSTLGTPNYSPVPLFQEYYLPLYPRIYYPEEYYNSGYYNSYYPSSIGLEWRSGLYRGRRWHR